MSLASLIACAITIAPPATPRLITFFPNLGDGVQVRMNFRLTQIANAPWPEATISCTNACQGNVHPSHNTCDTSCDVTCVQSTGRMTHIRNLAPHFALNFNESFGNFEAGVWRLSRNADVNPMREMLQRHMDRMLSMTYPNGEGTLSLQLQHWNTSPCAEWLKVYSYKTYSIEADCDAVRMVRSGTDIQTTEGPKAKINIGTLVMPDTEAAPLDVITPACLCSMPSVEEKDDFGFIPGGGAFGTRPDGYAINWAPASTWGSANLEIGCSDMNGFTIALTNGTTVPIRGVIGPGIILRPEDAKVQDMGIAEWARFTAPPGWAEREAANGLVAEQGQAFISAISGVSLAPTTAKGYAMCLDMDKREPQPGDKFKFGICGDEVLTRLLVFGGKERLKSPRDQTRFWIYRNAATAEEIRKRMLPGPRDDEYVRALQEVATIGLADLREEKYQKCFKPEYLAKAGQQRATDWFVATSSSWNATGLAAWMSSSIPAFENLLGGSSTSQERNHAGAVLNAFLSSPNQAMRQATLQVLGGLKPDVKKNLPMARDYHSFASWLMDEDAARAGDILKAIRLWSPQPFRAYLLNLNEKLPDGLKSEAKQLAETAVQTSGER